MLRYFCTLLCLTLWINGIAQEYSLHAKDYNVQDGLLHRAVKTVFEDKDGFLWIGSRKGLQRFDGHSFKTWTKADKSGLIYYISNIEQDDEGWLWLWNNDLLEFVFLHPQTEEILTTQERFGENFPINKKSNLQSTLHDPSSFLYKNSNGTLYVSTANPFILFTFSARNGIKDIPIQSDKHLKLHYIDREGNLWLFSKDNHVHLHDSNGAFLKEFPFSRRIKLFELDEKLLFIEYDEASGQNTSCQLYQITADKEKKLLQNLIAFQECKGGYYLREMATGWEFIDPKTNARLAVLEKGKMKLSEFYSDSHNRIWQYGEYGLRKIEIRKKYFKKYLSFDGEKLPFTNSARGIQVIDNEVFVNFEHANTVKFNIHQPKQYKVLQNKQWARPFYQNKKGNLYVGYPFHMIEMNTAGDILNKINYHFNQESVNGGWSMFEDKNECFWLGAGDKLLYKNKNENSFHIFKSENDPFDFTKRRGAIQNMLPAENGMIWFCSWTGLYLFDPTKKEILARYGADEPGEYYLPINICYYIHKDSEGIYWIGTDEGLIRWLGPEKQKAEANKPEPNTTYRLFSRNDGFLNNVIYVVFEDKHNRLWMSTDFGIISFDKTTENVQTYLVKDGISHHEFNRTSQFQTKDGTIYFGGLNGITAFHPDDFLTDEKNHPKMLLSNFEIFDGAEQKLVNRVGEVRQSKMIKVYPNDRFFRLKFTLPTFNDEDKMLYAWKVEGVDEDWNYQKQNSLQIGVLPYGTHTLHIKGQSGDGGWSPHELAIKVHVIKPFYLRIPFLALFTALLVLGVFSFFKWRTNSLKRRQKRLENEIEKATLQIATDKKTIEIQAEELRQLDKVKSRFFANVTHELRTPLTLMLGPISSVLKSGKLDNRNFTLLKKAQRGGKDLLKLIRSLLELSKMDSGKIEVQESPEILFPLVRRLSSAFESHAQQKGITFYFNYKAEKRLQILLDREKLVVILNNLLSNAMKFTPSGASVSVDVVDESKSILIKVTDTGRGIHAEDLTQIFNRFYQSKHDAEIAEGGTGIGLALSQEFVKMMGGKIWAESTIGEGTSFFVELPRKEVLGAVEIIEEPVMEEEEEFLLAKYMAEENNQPEAANEKRATILVVEDNPSLREYLETILEPQYHIRTAENGKIALEKLNNSEGTFQTLPSLILSDIMMPEMDGYQLLKAVKSNDQFRHIPIIMLTARADTQDKLKALRSGVDDYLLKPFEEEELLARISNLLSNFEERKKGIPQAATETNTADEVATQMSQEDTEWLEELEKYLSNEISNSSYSINQLAYDVSISERQLRRRLKQLTGLSPTQYFKEIRLQKARNYLENRTYKTVAQVANHVGFQDAGAFSRNFVQRFGKNPSNYLKY